MHSLLWGVVAVAANHQGWDLMVTDATFHRPQRTCYETSGLPSWVDGVYLVSGPARWSMGKSKLQGGSGITKMQGVFDGFGLINRFELKNGQVCYSSDWMDTKYANESESKGYPVGMIFEDSKPCRPSCSIFDLLCEMSAGGDNNWINAIKVGNEALLTSDTPQMLRLDLDTLEQKGLKRWLDDKPSAEGGMSPNWVKEGHLATVGSAHPVQIPGTNKYVDVLSEFGPVPGLEKSYLSVFTFDGDSTKPQNRPRIGDIPLDATPYLHSFGVTPNYIILPIDLQLAVTHLNLLNPQLTSALSPKWQGIHVMDMSGKSTRFETDSFTHVHIINSFENATGVTLDVGAYLTGSPFTKSGAMDIDMFLNKTDRDSNPMRAVPRRVHLHLNGPLKGKATFQDFQKIKGSHTDFFKLNPEYYGKPYCYYYGTQWWHDGENYATMATVKHNVCTDQVTYWSSPQTYIGEPYFIPAPNGDEDEGILVFMAIDGNTGKSTLKTLDGKTMQEVDGTSFSLEGHIPFTAHGNFFPSVKETAIVV